MSRIGKKPVQIPSGVTVSVDGPSRTITTTGSKGTLTMVHRPEVDVVVADDNKQVLFTIDPDTVDDSQVRAYWGLTRSLVNNMVEGVSKGYLIRLEVIGVGWGAKVQGQNVVLNVGFADPVNVPVPQGIDVKVEGSVITIEGIDKQVVGEFAASIRSKRKPEPYNGKGIKYQNEVIQRKQGKAFGA